MQKISAGKFHFEPPSQFTSLDHLVSDSEQSWREANAECLRGVQVDHELELGRLHHRQVAGLFALENAAGIDTSQAICISDARSVAHQTADFREVARKIDRRHPMVSRERNDLHAAVIGQRARTDQKRINWLPRKARKNRIDIATGADIEDFNLLLNGQSRSPDF